MAEGAEKLRIGRHVVELRRPDKVLFPDDDVTKRDLVDYYRCVFPWILPHLRARPISLERYPDGIKRHGIIQKEASSYFPRWIKKVTVKKTGGTVRQVVCDREATLVYLANQACITPHIWLSRTGRLHHPDLMVFDLDPSSKSFVQVKATAQALHELLEDLGLPAFVKTSGSRGLHVMVPLKGDDDFDSVRAFARKVAEIVVREDSQHRTLEQLKRKRRGRIFIDTNRNAYAQTVVPPYAVRARRGAPVSVPLDWSELKRGNLRPDGVTIRNLFDHMGKREDPWNGLWRHAVSLKKANSKLEDRHAA